MEKIIGTTLGNCVHVAGMMNFFQLAEREGYETEFLGIGVDLDKLVEKIHEIKPDRVALSFRLTPDSVKKILGKLKLIIDNDESMKDIEWIFGGTEPVSKVVEEYKIFDKIFYSTEDIDETIAYLKGEDLKLEENYHKNLIDRINSKYPYPLLRHHLGLNSIEDTVSAIEKIAEAKVIDVISVAPDQNAQEFFFDQENMDKALDGAGGVPVRSKDDFRLLYKAAQRGNYPLLRSYSGTKNLLKFAKVLQDSIENAWCAVPLFWYSVLDGRSKRSLNKAIKENQELMKWHGDRDIPVEVNDSHHFSLRDSHDAVAVADAYLAAYNAKQMGVKDYIAQFMFNVPANISPEKDLAKMLAKIELMEELEDDNFKIYRQARAGLASFPSDLNQAKGQLAASCYLALAIKPHIYHVVGFCEAHHAATAEDVIESAKIVRGVIKNDFLGSVDITKSESVIKRKEELIKDAKIILEAIKEIGKDLNDPLTDADNLAEAVKIGILDAPHLVGNKEACGKLKTRLVDGTLYPYSDELGRVVTEEERINMILEKYIKNIAI